MDTILWTVALMAAVGLVGSVLLSLVSKKLAIGEDERLTYLVSILPGANCGSCGYAGCEQYAKALMSGASPNACTPGGARVAEELAAFLGVESTGVVQREAFVACLGSYDRLDPKLEWRGENSCRVYSTLFYTSLSCPFACLGFGDCQAVCPFDAITVKDGLASIDPSLCTGCGACTRICPHNVIKVIDGGDSKNVAVVTCRNTMNGKKTRQVCPVGCIGCKKCQRACPSEAITVENNLARIDPLACTGCNTCVETCPTGAISPLVFR